MYAIRSYYENSSATLFKGLFQFDICELPKGYVITSANLAMYITTNENPSVSKLYYIFRVREEFDEATVTYNTVPDLDTSADCTAFSIGNELYTYTRVDITRLVNVITSYSIHYTKLYEGFT